MVLGEHKDSLWEGSYHLEKREGKDKNGWLEREKHTGTRGELEGGRNRRRSTGLDLDALADEKIIQVVYIKTRNTAFEKGVALSKLVFEMFSVAAQGESLTMPVFLVAGGSGGCASGASRMLRVAL